MRAAFLCIFHEVTGLYCPGCGATRMCRMLMQLDLKGAFRSNQVSVFVLPFIAAVFIRRIYLYIRYGVSHNEKWMDIGAVIYMEVEVKYGCNVVETLKDFKQKAIREIENWTAMNVAEMDVVAKSIYYDE